MCFKFCNDDELEGDYGVDLAPELFKFIHTVCPPEIEPEANEKQVFLDAGIYLDKNTE